MRCICCILILALCGGKDGAWAMKALILSCNTGQGHNTAGKALLEALTLRGIPAEMHDALSFGGKRTSVVVSGGYVKLTQIRPSMFGHLYRAGALISNPRFKSPVYYANTLYAARLKKFILDKGFDTILCPHLFPAEALTWLRSKHGLAVRVYGVATDYTCTPFWEETDVDVFFIPHKALRAEYEQKGFAPERLLETGIPVSRAFQQKQPMADARKALGLSQDKQLFLVMGGSMGFGDVPDIAAHLLALGPKNIQVLVMVGSNQKLKKVMLERFGGDERVLPVDYTTQVATYMDACDVTLTKPGGLSSTEAAVKQVPFVHTAPIPGCETANARFFGELGVSLPTTTALESAQAALLLAADASLKERQLACQRSEINPHAADDIIDELLRREALMPQL